MNGFVSHQNHNSISAYLPNQVWAPYPTTRFPGKLNLFFKCCPIHLTNARNSVIISMNIYLFSQEIFLICQNTQHLHRCSTHKGIRQTRTCVKKLWFVLATNRTADKIKSITWNPIKIVALITKENFTSFLYFST